MALFIGLTFAVLLITGLPIGFSLGVTSLAAIYKSGMTVLLNILPQRFLPVSTCSLSWPCPFS